MVCYDDERLSKQICVKLLPLTIASFSRSMFEYADWAGVSIFDANATGLSFCSRQAPNPFWDASTSRTVSFRGL